ncbi:hypothetical protein [Myxosarcina sp. GI1]|uniref:hypothetical protein n=1 Tax=Myxosarcina sp. GI1 TaxID=1541065 RepID=UPI0012E03ACD|nr:hypothetical protein [Myxosarcina sp. GI1]
MSKKKDWVPTNKNAIAIAGNIKVAVLRSPIYKNTMPNNFFIWKNKTNDLMSRIKN